MGSGGWLHKGKVLAPLMFVVLHENLSTLFLWCQVMYTKYDIKKDLRIKMTSQPYESPL